VFLLTYSWVSTKIFNRLRDFLVFPAEETMGFLRIIWLDGLKTPVDIDDNFTRLYFNYATETGNMGVGRMFSRGEIVGFSRGSREDFTKGENVVKFTFAHWKLRNHPFLLKTEGNVRFQNPVGTKLSCLPLPMPMTGKKHSVWSKINLPINILYQNFVGWNWPPFWVVQ